MLDHVAEIGVQVWLWPMSWGGDEQDTVDRNAGVHSGVQEFHSAFLGRDSFCLF